MCDVTSSLEIVILSKNCFPFDRYRIRLELHLCQAGNVLQVRRVVECLEQECISLLEIGFHNLCQSIYQACAPRITHQHHHHQSHTVAEHAVHLSYALPTIRLVWKCDKKPRIWCGTRPNGLAVACRAAPSE
jgi:hypothetical protein